MRILQIVFAIGLTLVALAGAHAHGYRIGEIKIGHPWTRATPPAAKVAGVFMTFTNEGGTADRLIGGSSPVAEKVEIHTMEVVDGIMKMRPLADGLEVPAGAKVELVPGSFHVMLIGLKQPIAEGDMVPLTLTFEKGGDIEVELAADKMGAGGKAHDHGSHGHGETKKTDHSTH